MWLIKHVINWLFERIKVHKSTKWYKKIMAYGSGGLGECVWVRGWLLAGDGLFCPAGQCVLIPLSLVPDLMLIPISGWVWQLGWPSVQFPVQRVGLPSLPVWLALSRCCSRWAYKISNTRFLKFLYITAWTQSSYSIGRAGAEVYNFSKYRWFLGEKQRVFKPSKIILKNIHLSGPWGRGFQRRWGSGEGLIDPFIYLIDNYAPDEGRESLVVVWNENMKVSSNFSFFRRNHHKPPPLNNLNKKCEIDYFNSDHKRDCGCNLIF